VREYWVTKRNVTGGKGDIEKGTLLVLQKKEPNSMTFVRAKPLPDGTKVQNRIVMHLPPLWQNDIRPATQDEIDKFLLEESTSKAISSRKTKIKKD